jgi:hypothetical protein
MIRTFSTQNEIKDKIKEYLDEGRSIRELASIFDVHYDTMRSWLLLSDLLRTIPSEDRSSLKSTSSVRPKRNKKHIILACETRAVEENKCYNRKRCYRGDGIGGTKECLICS